MNAIMKLARRHDLKVIEDCAQALGASYKDKPVGSWGDISVFSFYATKMICAGEGGMICTNDKKIYRQIRKSHGSIPKKSMMTNPKNAELIKRK